MTDQSRQSELDAMSDRLDELGQRERATPDHGFETRLFEAVRTRALEPLGRPVPMRTPWWRSSWTLATAASVAIVMTAAMFMWAGAPTPTPVGGPPIATAGDPSAEVDELIATVAWLEAAMPDFSWNANAADAPALDSIDDLLDDLEQTLSDEEESI